MGPRASRDAFERRINALVDELAHACNEPEVARMLATRGGVPHGDLPAFSQPRAFWNAVIRAAANGLVHGGVRAIVDEAARQYPANEIFARYRAGAEEAAEGSSQGDGRDASFLPSSDPNASLPRGTAYDVFVSHNGRDKPVVERLCRALLDAGVRPWFDKWDLAPGDLWIQEIERVLEHVPAVLVCVGMHGWSAWHEAERMSEIGRATEEGKGVVVPVLLPGAPEAVELPVFLRDRQQTDLRDEAVWEHEVERLAATLTGRASRSPWIDERRERPYRGLQPFTEADAGWMFGREQEEAKLLDALRNEERFVAVVGASGSGKSSLVRAGVVPAVRTGAIDGRQRWHALVMRPGTRPCHALALRILELQRTIEGTDADVTQDRRRLKELSGDLTDDETSLSDTVDLLFDRDDRDDRLVLVVDQFEELLTANSGEDARADGPHESGNKLESTGTRLSREGMGLLQNLLHATSTKAGRVHVIITVRADFTGECLSVPALARRMERLHFALPPMAADQLREAIRRPALRAGYDVEKALVDALVSATKDQPGRLPLLQHTLDLLWDVRDRQQHRLTYEAYDNHVGSLEQSVAKRAEDVFAKLIEESAEHEAAVRRVFLRLVHLREGTGDTRRRVLRSELSRDAARLVLDRFIQARLLVTDVNREIVEGQPEQVIEIAHEALLVRWIRLRRWLDDNRELLRLRQEVNVAATRWVTFGRPVDELWHGGRLARSCEALLDDEVDLAPNERLFLEACEDEERRRQEERERQQQERLEAAQRLARVFRRALVGLGAVGLVAVLAAVVAWLQYRVAETSAEEANEERNRARRASLMGYARGFGERDPTRASIGLLEVDSMDAPGWRQEVVDILQHPIASVVLRGHDRGVVAASFSPDGTRIVTASWDGAARVWNADGSGTAIVLRSHSDRVVAASFSPDGTRIVTASWDGTARVWNANGSGTAIVLLGHHRWVNAASFSPDGTHIVTASEDETAQVWNADGSGTPIVLEGHARGVAAASFSPDSTRIVTASDDDTAQVWNADGSDTPIVLVGHDDDVVDASFSPDGTRIVTASADGTARVWNADGSGTPTVLHGHDDRVVTAGFSPDGTSIVTTSHDNTARVWNVDGTGTPAVLRGHEDDVQAASFSPDGTRIVTASEDHTARVWNADGSGTPSILRGHDSGVVDASFSPDGARIVTTSGDKTARVWNANGSGTPSILRGHEHGVVEASFSPDGTRIVTASGKTAWVWNADGSGTPTIFQVDGYGVNTASFSPDGTRIVSAYEDSTVRVWNADGSGIPIILRGHDSGVVVAGFSPDGTRIVSAYEDSTVRVWNANGSGSPTILQGHGGRIVVAGFSPDGTRIVTASEDHTARVWNVDDSGLPIVLRGHGGRVVDASFSPDGTRIVTTSEDTTARVWNADGSGTPTLLQGHDGEVWDASFSPDGTRIVTVSEDHTARVWNADGSNAPLVLRGHDSGVVKVSFSPDGIRIVTASFDKTVRVWNVDDLGPPVVLRGHDDAVVDASFSPDGTHIVTASLDKTARVWPIADTLLHDLLESATSVCIPVEERTFYLGETLDQARDRFTACEIEHHRPAPIWD